MTSTAEVRDMGNEALLDEYESATARHRSDHGDCTDADDFDVLRAELLRRLSAGNPRSDGRIQGESEQCGKAWCSHTHYCSDCKAPVLQRINGRCSDCDKAQRGSSETA